MDAVAAAAGASARVRLVEGGPTRRESVANGLRAVERSRVVVHDAARPFATEEMVTMVLEALRDADAAVTALPAEDTIKEVDGHIVVRTVDRSRLWLVQTPQAFVTERLRAAHDRAERDGLFPTDDAQLLETYGGRVAVVTGSRANLKITYPEDFGVAEALAAGR